MNNPIKFYFVCLSPWSYLAMEALQDIADRHQREIIFKPIDVGRTWAETGAGKPLRDRANVLQTYRLIELERWASWRGVSLNPKPKHHPVPFNLSSGMIIAAIQTGVCAFEITRALMKGCWVHEKDISNPDDVLAIVDSIGINGKELLDMVESEEVVSVLSANTDEALLDGAWSVPSFVVDSELFFGQDRLEMMDWRLSGS